MSRSFEPALIDDHSVKLKLQKEIQQQQNSFNYKILAHYYSENAEKTNDSADRRRQKKERKKRRTKWNSWECAVQQLKQFVSTNALWLQFSFFHSFYFFSHNSSISRYSAPRHRCGTATQRKSPNDCWRMIKKWSVCIFSKLEIYGILILASIDSKEWEFFQWLLVLALLSISISLHELIHKYTSHSITIKVDFRYCIFHMNCTARITNTSIRDEIYLM